MFSPIYTQEQIDMVIRLFPDYTRNELIALTGVGKSTIDRLQRKYHLTKSPEHIHNMGVRAGKASFKARGNNDQCNTPQAITKRSATYKATLRRETLRVNYGMGQKTKIKLKWRSDKQTQQSWYLHTLGYIVDDKNRIAYYTDTTRRAVRLEKLARNEKHGVIQAHFDFKPLCETQSSY